jgi:DNA-binding NtrC family response regulator
MPDKGLIHLIDDEPIIHEVMSQLLTSEGYEVEISSSGEEAVEKANGRSFDLTLLDLLMPGMNGIEVLRHIRRIHPQAVIIIITAYASVESAIEAMKMGAFDYIQKPFKHDELLLTIQRALEHKQLQEENIRLKHELKRKFGFENIIGNSKPMQAVFEMIRAAAPTRSTILLQGESGTGKELVARAIHQNSERSGFPFVHVRGAFTGAVSHKKGLFEEADQGTIFFDEISTISLETQAKLLRVMQDREFMRLGGTKTVRVDVRLVAATNTSLEDLIEQKAFRKDLYYRLNVIKIELPPLRVRKDDVPLLVRHFLGVYSRENRKDIEGISEDVMEILEAYDWPGNVRELENLIERAIVLTKSRIISRDSLPGFFLQPQQKSSAAFLAAEPNLNLKDQMQDFQKNLILTALKRAKGIQKNAAQSMGVKPTTLNEMIKRLGIDIDDLS